MKIIHGKFSGDFGKKAGLKLALLVLKTKHSVNRQNQFSSSFLESSFFFSPGGFFPMNMSAKSPAKTRRVPNHCRPVSELPKNRTEKSTVKNFLVVVTTEQGRGPKPETIMKMKS